MANRIPPSLNWLIDKRARVAGEISKAKRLLKKAQASLLELEELESKLKAIDSTMELHNIRIDIGLIKPIESKDLKLNIPHGELTRSILTCIKLYESEGPVSKETITNFVFARHSDFDCGKKILISQLRVSIQNRLAGLYHQGYLVRHHSTKSNNPGLWTLSDKWKFD